MRIDWATPLTRESARWRAAFLDYRLKAATARHRSIA